MGKTKGQTEDGRSFRINNRFLITVLVLTVLTLAAAAVLLPDAGRTISAYSANRAAFRKAEAEYKAALEDNERINNELGELKAMQRDIPALREEVFSLAAALEQDIIDGRSDKRICYITLDDGPYNRGREFLEIFRKYDVKATFFLTTANGNKLPDQGELSAESMYPEYLKYGHTIGNHTYSHNYSEGGVYSDADAFMASVEKQENFTAKAVGSSEYRSSMLVRFPGGKGTAGAKLEDIKTALSNKGYGWIDWTIDSGDSHGTDEVSPEYILKRIKKASEKQRIMVILCHEWSSNTLEAMPDIIKYLDSKGYIFMPLFYDSVMVEKEK